MPLEQLKDLCLRISDSVTAHGQLKVEINNFWTGHEVNLEVNKQDLKINS